MPKFLTRIVAFVLIPCLLAGTVKAREADSLCSRCEKGSLFLTQALAPELGTVPFTHAAERLAKDEINAARTAGKFAEPARRHILFRTRTVQQERKHKLKQIGIKLRTFRTSYDGGKGLTLAELAAKAEVKHRVEIHRYELGKAIPEDVAKRLGVVFNVDYQEFVLGQGETDATIALPAAPAADPELWAGLDPLNIVYERDCKARGEVVDIDAITFQNIPFYNDEEKEYGRAFEAMPDHQLADLFPSLNLTQFNQGNDVSTLREFLRIDGLHVHTPRNVQSGYVSYLDVLPGNTLEDNKYLMQELLPILKQRAYLRVLYRRWRMRVPAAPIDPRKPGPMQMKIFDGDQLYNRNGFRKGFGLPERIDERLQTSGKSERSNQSGGGTDRTKPAESILNVVDDILARNEIQPISAEGRLKILKALEIDNSQAQKAWKGIVDFRRADPYSGVGADEDWAVFLTRGYIYHGDIPNNVIFEYPESLPQMPNADHQPHIGWRYPEEMMLGHRTPLIWQALYFAWTMPTTIWVTSPEDSAAIKSMLASRELYIPVRILQKEIKPNPRSYYHTRETKWVATEFMHGGLVCKNIRYASYIANVVKDVLYRKDKLQTKENIFVYDIASALIMQSPKSLECYLTASAPGAGPAAPGPTHSIAEYKILVGRRLKELRTRKHLSQSQLGHLFEITQPSVWFIESGKGAGFLSFWLRVARYFQVPIEILLDVDLPLPENTQGSAIRMSSFSSLGERLTDAMTTKGLSHSELAELIDLTQPGVSYSLKQLMKNKDILLASYYLLVQGIGITMNTALNINDLELHAEALRASDPDRDKPHIPLGISENNYRMRMGERVLMLRRSRGLTQNQIAKEIGVTQPSINSIENGNHSSSFLHWIRMAAFFAIPLEIFLDIDQPLTAIANGDKAPKPELIGRRILSCVAASGLSQGTLARFIGTTQPAINILLRSLGNGRSVMLSKVYSIAWALQKSMYELLTFSLEPHELAKQLDKAA